MAEREHYLFWQLINYFVIEQDYRLIHIDREEKEAWLETVGHKKLDVIRILVQDIDWTNWLKRDIIQTGLRAAGIRKHLMKREVNVLNIYVTEHTPVDDYEHAIQHPYDTENGKAHIQTILMAKETANDAIYRMNEMLNSHFQTQAMEIYDPALTNELRQSAIQKTKRKQEEEKELFEYGKPFFTYLFIAVQVLMFLIVESSGGSTNVETLIKYGAKYNPLILTGEWWRFFTPIFLHIGLLHLLMNTLALYYLGMAVEKIFGRFRFLWIYLFSGFTGSVASFVFTNNLSAGASGAIFGCFGALLYMGVVNPRLFFRTIGVNVIAVIIINLIFGFTVPGIDNAGHIGGLIGGFLATGIVHFPGKRKWGLQFVSLLMAASAVYFMLNWGYHNDRPDTENERAQGQIENGDYEAAYETLLGLVSEGEEDANSYFKLAYSEVHLQKYEDAKKHFKKAIELEPDFHEAHFNLASIYYEQGDIEAAKKHASKAEEISDQEKYRDFLKEIE